MNKTRLIVAALLAVSSTHLLAETAAAEAAPTPDWTVTGNVAVSSEYRTRGISQSDKMPAVSGGFDVVHSSGFYFGNWNSNIDSDYYTGANLELDFWTGYRGAVGDIGYDVGVFYYYYPGSGRNGAPSIDNKEIYVGTSYGPVSARLYIPVDDFFSAEKLVPGGGNAAGSVYLDLSAAYDLSSLGAPGFGVIGHFGYQKLKGAAQLPDESSGGKLVSHYYDWKLGVNYTFSTGHVVSLTYIDTDIEYRAYKGGRMISGATGVLSVSKTF